MDVLNWSQAKVSVKSKPCFQMRSLLFKTLHPTPGQVFLLAILKSRIPDGKLKTHFQFTSHGILF